MVDGSIRDEDENKFGFVIRRNNQITNTVDLILDLVVLLRARIRIGYEVVEGYNDGW